MEDINRFKVIFLFPNAFPVGGAATNRLFHMAKGINENGADVKVICTRGTEKESNIINKDINSVHRDIPFTYASGSVIWPSSSFGKAKELLNGLINTCKIIVRSEPDIVISYAIYGFLHNFFFLITCRSLKIKFLYAVDEFPWVEIYRHKYSFLYRKFYLTFFYRLFDGLIVMTNVLAAYYANLKRKKALIHLMPMTVEIERFEKAGKHNPEAIPYTAYCGWDIKNVNGTVISKDGIEILINAFSIICNKHKNLNLLIIGENNEERHLQAERLGITERIIFKGEIHYDKMPDYLCNAVLLCLARPDNLQANGGFPTKLGEYLATGNPVVVTNVGEISNYLEDGWSALLAAPGDANSFAEKLDYALSNPEIAKTIGIRGKQVAINAFDYKKQGTILYRFLSELPGK